MTIVNLHFETKINIEEIIDSLLSLPSELRPVYFSANEGKKNGKDLISDTPRFLKFIEKNTLGFFLYSEPPPVRLCKPD